MSNQIEDQLVPALVAGLRQAMAGKTDVEKIEMLAGQLMRCLGDLNAAGQLKPDQTGTALIALAVTYMLRETAKAMLKRKWEDKRWSTSIESDGKDIYVVVNGKRIAKRGHPGTPQAKTWISLEPGWQVSGDSETLALRYEGVAIQ